MNQPVLETKKIILTTILSLIVGSFILSIAVLPAEYGIDPTGLGKILGFNKLYQKPAETEGSLVVAGANSTKILLIKDGGCEPGVERPKEADNPAPEAQYTEREDSVQIHLPAGKGKEYKVRILKYGKLMYDWHTDKGFVYSDLHGDVKEEKPSKETYYESYTVANSHTLTGTLLAAYEGVHGWWFKNNTSEPITLTVHMKGEYELEPKFHDRPDL